MWNSFLVPFCEMVKGDFIKGAKRAYAPLTIVSIFPTIDGSSKVEVS